MFLTNKTKFLPLRISESQRDRNGWITHNRAWKLLCSRDEQNAVRTEWTEDSVNSVIKQSDLFQAKWEEIPWDLPESLMCIPRSWGWVVAWLLTPSRASSKKDKCLHFPAYSQLVKGKRCVSFGSDMGTWRESWPHSFLACIYGTT